MKTSIKILSGLTFLGLLLATAKVKSQGIDDALRFSEHQASGSARVMGIGGSQTAIGGDVSNIHGNPAGLGFFRKSEFSFTASYGNLQSRSTFLNQIQEDNTGNFALPNLSIVLSNMKDPLNRDKWRGHTFGISINRSHSLNRNFGYTSSRSGNSSLLDYYVNDYTNFGEPPLGDPAGLPLDVEIIEINSDNTFEKSDYAIGNPFQSELIENEGSRSQVTFSFGGNYDNKLFVGAAVGITSINFRSFKTYKESFIDESDIKALDYELRENLYQNGTGINLNLGMIYKPIDELNLGVSFRSPTWSRFEDEFDADLYAQFYDIEGDPEFENYETSDIYISTINLRSPMKISGGATFFFQKNGFITADVDYLDYSTMHFSSPDFSLDNANQEVNQFAEKVINYRIGGEYRFDIFRIRAGTGFYGDPLDEPDRDRSRIQYTGGIGVRLPKMYIDFGLVHSQFDSYYFSYPTADPNFVDNKQTTGFLTFGFNF
ncbi:long-chain fatty acid transporter [Echinicola jeungdonensis]|uniref:OmpP1/FadL family transporter n=1 Tax=Echinicola jeungdonensis TaxID=709343 RepID=A0ABV5J2P1_9BACT|nr:long-chain fatty acid transporter [Echinicola jeungdonensis]MDN3668299.1 long-chain fatty acid transporter [Echinicola jeungdonensis]